MSTMPSGRLGLHLVTLGSCVGLCVFGSVVRGRMSVNKYETLEENNNEDDMLLRVEKDGWGRTILRSIPYASAAAALMGLSGMSTTIGAWRRFYAGLDKYLDIEFILDYESYFILALVVAPMFNGACLVLSTFETGRIHEIVCASQRTCWTRAVGRAFSGLATVLAYILAFVYITLFAGFAAVFGFKTLFDFACDESSSFSASHCIDLSQFGLGSDLCGPSFQAFCDELKGMNADIITVIAGLILLIAAEINVVAIHSVNYNRVKARTDNSRAARAWRKRFYDIPVDQNPLLSTDPVTDAEPTTDYIRVDRDGESGDGSGSGSGEWSS